MQKVCILPVLVHPIKAVYTKCCSHTQSEKFLKHKHCLVSVVRRSYHTIYNGGIIPSCNIDKHPYCALINALCV